MLLVLTLDIRLRLVLEITHRHIRLLLKIKKHTDNRLVLTTHTDRSTLPSVTEIKSTSTHRHIPIVIDI